MTGNGIDTLREKLGLTGACGYQDHLAGGTMPGMGLKEKAVKKGLFEIVQAVAVELGDFFTYLQPYKKFVFQGYDIVATVDFNCKVDDDRKYYAPAAVNVEVNGNIVFQELKCLDGDISRRPKPVVKTYVSGAWESQLWRFYEDAMHLKARREARREALRERVRSAGNRRSASIF